MTVSQRTEGRLLAPVVGAWKKREGLLIPARLQMLQFGFELANLLVQHLLVGYRMGVLDSPSNIANFQLQLFNAIHRLLFWV